MPKTAPPPPGIVSEDFTMKKVFCLPLLLLFVFNAACQSSGRRDPYLIPEDVWVREPTPVPTPAPKPPPPALEADESAAPRPSRGLFGRRRAETAETVSASEPPAAAGSTPVPPPVPTPLPELSAAYLLQVGDPLIISVSGPQLEDRFETSVDERGFVKLRFIGSVRATGRTATELEREIEAEYTDRQKIYREVYVRVHVPNNFYFIGGEIRQPGRFPLVGRVTLSQAVVAAGNFTEWARRDGRLILVRNNERSTLFFRDIVSDPSQDVELRPGDVITVERSTF